MSKQERKEREELYHYHNQDLMRDVNNFLLDVKLYLYYADKPEMLTNHIKPSIQDIDSIHTRLMTALSQSKEPLIKR